MGRENEERSMLAAGSYTFCVLRIHSDVRRHPRALESIHQRGCRATFGPCAHFLKVCQRFRAIRPAPKE